jgi:hypothetical protein
MVTSVKLFLIVIIAVNLDIQAMKLKFVLILVSLLITVATIVYIDYGIHHFGLEFHTGKDGGYFKRFESIVLLSTLFYILNTIHPKSNFVDYLISGFAGFFAGILIGIFCYLIIESDNGLVYHIISVGVCYVSFYLIRLLKNVSHQKRHPLNNECLSIKVS